MPKKSVKQGSPSNSHGAQGQGHGKGKGASNAGESWKKSPGGGSTAGSPAKNGCFPKLLTMVLPFVAIGTYFLLRS